MSVPLPDTLRVLERGWLSANSVVFLEGDGATVVDSGYVTHAAQTVELVRSALDGRRLSRLINTHAHSDHIGGNAALKAAFGCAITVPAGHHAAIADWDEDALLLSPLGQQGARFQHDALIGAGCEIEMGGLVWKALAVPGHEICQPAGGQAAAFEDGKGEDDLDRVPGQLFDVAAELVQTAKGALEGRVDVAKGAAVAGNDNVDGQARQGFQRRPRVGEAVGFAEQFRKDDTEAVFP